MLLQWDAAEDDSAVAGYLVTMSGVPVGLTDTTTLIVAGLAADTAYTPSVRAVDAAGLLGPAATGPAVRTRAEDRGP